MKHAVIAILLVAASRCEQCQPPPPPPDGGPVVDDGGLPPPDDAGSPDAGVDAGPPPAPVWCYQPPHASGPTDDQCFSSLNDCEAGRAFWQGRASECWEAAAPP
jgi:hypothetical protein